VATKASKASSVARRPRLVLGDHEGRLVTVNLGPFVGVDLNMLPPTVYVAVIVLKMNQTKPKLSIKIF